MQPDLKRDCSPHRFLRHLKRNCSLWSPDHICSDWTRIVKQPSSKCQKSLTSVCLDQLGSIVGWVYPAVESRQAMMQLCNWYEEKLCWNAKRRRKRPLVWMRGSAAAWHNAQSVAEPWGRTSLMRTSRKRGGEAAAADTTSGFLLDWISKYQQDQHHHCKKVPFPNYHLQLVTVKKEWILWMSKDPWKCLVLNWQ